MLFCSLKLYKVLHRIEPKAAAYFQWAYWKELEGHELRPADHTALSETEVTKFRRTVDVIEKDPWLLKKGAEYLRTLCSNSEKDSWGSPPPLEDLTAADSALKLPSNLDWATCAPEQPRTVFVSAVKPKAKAKGKVGGTALPEPKGEAKGKAKGKALAVAKSKAKGKARCKAPAEAAATPPPALGCSKCPIRRARLQQEPSGSIGGTHQ